MGQRPDLSSDRPALLGGMPLSARPLRMARPVLPGLESIGPRLADTLRSGMVTNQGGHVRELEDRIAAYLGVPSVACTCNGQSAVMLALRAAGVADGEVIVPAYTFSATPHAVCWCGATPVFADILPGTLCLDPEDVAERITERTVAIMPVDVYGIATDHRAFEGLCRRHGLRLVVDAAPAFGTRVAGRPVGREGSAQAFSFHATKAFTTLEGGCVASGDRELVARASRLRNFGQSDGADCTEAGLNAKMTEVCALVGLALLDGLDAAVERRGATAARYRRRLGALDGLGFVDPPADQAPTWLYFPVIVEPGRFGLDRDALVQLLAAENLFVRPYFGLPCHRLACYADRPQPRLPVTERVAAQVLSLPIYNDMQDTEVDLFVEALRRAQRHAAAVRAHLA